MKHRDAVTATATIVLFSMAFTALAWIAFRFFYLNGLGKLCRPPNISDPAYKTFFESGGKLQRDACIEYWLNRYQTIVGATATLAAGVLAWRAAVRQIRLVKQASTNETARDFRVLMFRLTSLSDNARPLLAFATIKKSLLAEDTLKLMLKELDILLSNARLHAQRFEDQLAQCVISPENTEIVLEFLRVVRNAILKSEKIFSVARATIEVDIDHEDQSVRDLTVRLRAKESLATPSKELIEAMKPYEDSFDKAKKVVLGLPNTLNE